MGKTSPKPPQGGIYGRITLPTTPQGGIYGRHTRYIPLGEAYMGGLYPGTYLRVVGIPHWCTSGWVYSSLVYLRVGISPLLFLLGYSLFLGRLKGRPSPLKGGAKSAHLSHTAVYTLGPTSCTWWQVWMGSMVGLPTKGI